MELCGIAVDPTELSIGAAIAYGFLSEVVGASRLKNNTVAGLLKRCLESALLSQADTPATRRYSRTKNPARGRSTSRRAPSKRSSPAGPK